MIKTDIANSEKFSSWIKTRGGIAQWDAIDFSNNSCFTPAFSLDGKRTEKPHWKYSNDPTIIIIDPTQVSLITSKEVKRFHIAVRRSSNGFNLKCTDHSSKKIRTTLDKLGKDAYYIFDYDTQEAVFYITDSSITLKEWEEKHENALR